MAPDTGGSLQSLAGAEEAMEDINALEDLLALQEVDSHIDHLLERRAGLPILTEYREAHERTEHTSAERNEVSDRLHQLTLALDKAEGEMGLDEEKLEQEERRLYAGGLSARDATFLRDEVEMLRNRVSKREDEVLVLLEQREAEEQALAAVGGRLAVASAEEKRLEAEIEREWAAIDAEVAALKEKKATMVPGIDVDLLALYEEIRPTKDGVAVAQMVDRVCGGCHLALSAAEEVEALKSWPPRCLHCRRLIVPR